MKAGIKNWKFLYYRFIIKVNIEVKFDPEKENINGHDNKDSAQENRKHQGLKW